MKTRFYTKTIIALAVAAAAAAGAVSQAQEQPIPPPAGDSALPADIVPGSALAEVVKMVQAGVDVGTINSYIVNSPNAFNLDADKIIFLKDEGVPSDLINAMLGRDKLLYASTVAPPPAPVSDAAAAPDTAPPPAEVDVNYFNNTLTPYGSWVDVEGYGRCWRPTVVIYDSSWRPYCDRGHWVNSDYGWYWDSDYSWGMTFHYGRWFQHSRLGWCWYPDTVWAPSWVTWRSSSDYCGWAPLPPLAVFRPGGGFFYRGVSVGIGFDFGLNAGCFTFLSPGHFYDRHPRYYSVEPQRARQIFQQTRVINDFNVHSRFMVNRGIPVEHINSVTHHPIEPVHIGSLPNAGRQGWRGEGFDRSAPHGAVENNPGRNLSNGNGQQRPGPILRNDPGNDANANRRQNLGQPAPGPNPNGNRAVPPRSPAPEPPGNRNDQINRDTASHNPNPQPNNNGQNANRIQRPDSPPALGNNRLPPPTSATPPPGAATPEQRQLQNNRLTGGNNAAPPQNVSREPRQPPVANPQPNNNGQNANRIQRPDSPPALGNNRLPPPTPATPPPQPRQFNPPATPAPIAPPQRGAPQLEQRPVQNQNVAAPAPRSSNPPAQPAPVPSQPRNAGSGSSTSSDKDKTNH